MKLSYNLTPRQRAFLDKLVELYREHRGPVHYTDVAEELGVNRFSAYDMLKVLEGKGLVASSYALSAGHVGPGRTLVVFGPTAQAARLEAPLPTAAGEELAGVRERILLMLREARDANYRDILDDLLSHLPDAKTPMVYCAEMIGILLLNMRRATAYAGNLNPFRVLATLQVDDRAGLETLAGLSVGTTLAADAEAPPSLTRRLLRQARRYQATVSRLGEDARSALGEFLAEALEALD